MLKLCTSCGPTEALVAADGPAWVAAFLARGDVPADSPGDHLFKHTTSTCPTCLTLAPAPTS